MSNLEQIADQIGIDARVVLSAAESIASDMQKDGAALTTENVVRYLGLHQKRTEYMAERVFQGAEAHRLNEKDGVTHRSSGVAYDDFQHDILARLKRSDG